MADTAVVVEYPTCDFCKVEPARYDFKTVHGPWANGCLECYVVNRKYDELGTGKGQLLVK